jgi:hypothetical protein
MANRYACTCIRRIELIDGGAFPTPQDPRD